MFDFCSRCARATCVAVLLALACGVAADGANGTAFLSGTVTKDGAPVSNAQVTVAGNHMTIATTTDANGRFSFPPLAVGSYHVTAKSGIDQGSISVDLGGGGATVAVQLGAPTEIGRVVVAPRQVPASVIQGSGSDVALNGTALTQLPFDNSFTNMEIQMPGAVRGANGVVHLNGDHGVINYVLDGVALPQELNRDIGGEINLNNLSFVDLIEGAYPAQSGMRFGSVRNVWVL